MGETILKALIMNPISADITEFYKYLVIKDNKIEELSRRGLKKKYPKAKLIDLEDRIIIPGLVDCHTHLPQYPNIGVGGDLELLEWLEKHTFPAEKRFEDPDYAQEVATIFFNDLISNGTTTVSVFSSIHEEATDRAFIAASRSGIRANIGKVLMDQNAPEYLIERSDEAIASARRLAERWEGKASGRLHFSITPRFAPTCSYELLVKAGELKKDLGLNVQTHLGENKGEISLVKKLFASRDNYASIYGAAKLLGGGTIMAHSIHLLDEEIIMLRETDTGIAHCPCSNNFVQSGIMPYMKYKEKGLKMGLGSDISCGYSISMFSQMRKALEASKYRNMMEKSTNQKSMSATDALYLATLGGARVMNLDNKIGNFKPGKDADFIVLENPNPLGKLNPNNKPKDALLRLCYSATKEHIEQVYVQGKLIYSK